MEEWLEFHAARGVEHFFLYNNDSTDDYASKLTSRCTVIDWPGKAQQMPAYNHHAKTRPSKWTAYLDMDEFLFSPMQQDLRGFIEKEYNNYSAIGANWVMYGPCGHKTRPAGKVWDNYTQPTGDGNLGNLHVKSIVRNEYIVHWGHPHTAQLRAPHVYVDENKKSFTGALTPAHSVNKLRINHYYTKSEEECRLKAERGRSDNGQKRDADSMLRSFGVNPK